MGEAYQAMRQAWLNTAAEALALCVTSASALLDLDAVVIDGSVSPALLATLIEHTQAQMNRIRFDGIHRPTLVAGMVGASARALGGSLLPLHAQFFPDKDIFLKQDL
jgi:predicted NBD/HSP70 family sugar kinase